MHLLLPILNAFFLVLYATNIEATPPKMIVFRGIVRQTLPCWEFSVSNFTECLVKCGTTELCQFAYGNGRCNLCIGGQIAANKFGEWVGIKNVNKTIGSFCPAGTINISINIQRKNVTTENPLGIVGDIEDNDAEVTEVSTSEEPTTTTPKPSCPAADWFLVENEWCIKLTFLEKGMTKSEAVKVCKNLNTTVKSMVSGLEYDGERAYVIREVLKSFDGKPQRYNIGVWIDGYRASACTLPNSICFPETFQFNDGRLRTYAGYDWYDSYLVSPNATCIQVMFPVNKSDPRSGKVSFADCNFESDDFVRSSVLCGTPAL